MINERHFCCDRFQQPLRLNKKFRSFRDRAVPARVDSDVVHLVPQQQIPRRFQPPVAVVFRFAEDDVEAFADSIRREKGIGRMCIFVAKWSLVAETVMVFVQDSHYRHTIFTVPWQMETPSTTGAALCGCARNLYNKTL